MKENQRILVIGLSNVGDAVLMSPVIDRLARRYPQAQMSLLVGERAQAVFAHDPRIQHVMALEDFEGGWGRLRLVGLLWRLRPDLLIDLRHTALPLFWKPWRLWRYLWPTPTTVHRRVRHLRQLAWQDPSCAAQTNGIHPTVWIGEDDRQTVDRLLERLGLNTQRPLVVVCPGARSHIKRWGADRFAAVADRLIEEVGVELVVTGEPDEVPVAREMLSAMRQRAHSLAGRTTIRQLAALMQRARLVITNDSASLHLACAVSVPVVAIFGPTDAAKYGPTGPQDRVIRRRLFCAPCEQATCRFHLECLRFVSVDEVYNTAVEILTSGVR